MSESRTRKCAIHIDQDGVPGTRCRIAELGTKRTMVAEHDAYATKDFTGGSPCADSVDKQISHGRPIDTPQFCYDAPKVRPPRLQFSIRHEWLLLTASHHLRRRRLAAVRRLPPFAAPSSGACEYFNQGFCRGSLTRATRILNSLSSSMRIKPRCCRFERSAHKQHPSSFMIRRGAAAPRRRPRALWDNPHLPDEPRR